MHKSMFGHLALKRVGWVLPVISAVLLSGCLSPAPKAPTLWVIDFARGEDGRNVGPKCGDSVRISTIDVRSPYSGQRLAVLRPDGSIAFDAFNTFAAAPAQLLRGAAYDLVEASGRFGHVFSAGSAVQTTYTLEIVVTQLALDCRTADRRTASAACVVTLLKGRELVAIVRGTGAANMSDDDYSAAFSTAFARAMQDALGKLPVQ